MKKLVFILSVLAPLASPALAQDAQVPIVLAQSGGNLDYRVSVMEEHIRQLNGKIEELNFQLLELQERMRRMQEDNDFRFQQLEEKQGSLPDNGETAIEDDDGFIRLGKSQPSDSAGITPESDGKNELPESQGITPANPAKTIDGVEIYQGDQSVDSNIENSLGTIQFDQNGNVVNSAIGKPLDFTAGLRGNQNGAGLPTDPEGLFQTGYDFVQTGRYEDAETALVLFSQKYNSDVRLPEARFWLGESYLGRGQFDRAAEVYLDVQKRWPNGKYGAQSLLKLGISVAGLNQRELACATFAEVLQKYPNASRALQRSVAHEQRAAKCTTQ